MSLKTDNGPQYTSGSFKRFAAEWEFDHKFSSPGNSQSNGCAEAHEKICKNLLKKCLKSGEDPYLGLLNLRNTLTKALGSSPAQRTMGRRTQTLVPATQDALLPAAPDARRQLMLKEEQQTRVAERYLGNQSLQPLHIGDTVRVQPMENGNQPR